MNHVIRDIVDDIEGLSADLEWNVRDGEHPPLFGKQFQVGDELRIDIRPVVYGNCVSINRYKIVQQNFTMGLQLNFTNLERMKKQIALYVHDEDHAIGKRLLWVTKPVPESSPLESA